MSDLDTTGASRFAGDFARAGTVGTAAGSVWDVCDIAALQKPAPGNPAPVLTEARSWRAMSLSGAVFAARKVTSASFADEVQSTFGTLGSETATFGPPADWQLQAADIQRADIRLGADIVVT